MSDSPANPTPTNASTVNTKPTDPKGLVEYGYDQIAPKYHAWVSARPSVTRGEYLKKLIDLLPSGAKVLELGCGAGVPCTQTMIERGLNVTATDISASQIALAKEHVPKATFIQSDMMALDLPAGSFDAVVAFYSIIHLPKEEHGMMIEKMAGWVKEGGWLLFSLNTPEGDIVREDWMGVRMFSSSLGIEGNREMLKKHGRNLKLVEDEIAVEKVGRAEEKFHWVLAVKKGPKEPASDTKVQ